MHASNSDGQQDPASIMREVNTLLAAGRTVDAEDLTRRWAHDVRQRSGAGSHRDAVAQHQLGSLLLNVGQLDHAIEAFREAVVGEAPSEPQALRDRLTFLTSLGQALAAAKEYEQAEQVLAKGLEGRGTFYGAEHAGYAFGLEPLAEVTMRLGDADAALEMIEQVIGNFWRNGHDRIAGAIAIRAEMLKTAGKATPPFAGLEKLPTQAIERIAGQAIARAARMEDLKIARQVLADLTPMLEARLGPSDAGTVDLLIAASNIERKLNKEGDAKIRQDAIGKLIGIFDAQGRARDALQAAMGLALAHGDAGQTSLAVETYLQALARAASIGDPGETSQVLRNLGLLLAELKQDGDAERRLRESVEHAERSGDGDLLGRSLIAVGVLLQHGGRPEEALAFLRRALPLLDPADADAITCKSHLRAIETGVSCGCGEMEAGIAEAFREFVMAKLPPGLLQRLDVALEGGEFSIGVHLDRRASDDELKYVNRVVQHALEEFRRKVARER
ncbi:MAG TPA: tetratricopeptide repeat protein [Tepidisphaeraceae bacterium]|nr:tetratricopeptide repeat protein [Tepidisphaeraceae bacterium]